ncbi:hypothetical protein BOX15_Mlig017750g1 [Macrostomum lignano]|uniref:SNRNP25 ubiquitin-like domain-containing protein n=1 Tax=Macrostomum lignano TaxID=282301 RepID=A0A267FFC1_9PLAT|nr:hypothetical protein BOX15_Mlig017750g1 [Macrostomum lignano]
MPDFQTASTESCAAEEQLLSDLVELSEQVARLIKCSTQLEDLRDAFVDLMDTQQLPSFAASADAAPVVGRSSQRSASQLTGIENFAIGTESWRYAAFKSDRLLQRQLGRCWLIRVSRGDLHSLDCFVEPEATIAELKHVVALESKHLIRRLGGPYRSVSWRQVWRRFALALGSKKLLDDRATLSDCGLSNRCQLTFVPRLREKPSGGRRRRQQWQQ